MMGNPGSALACLQALSEAGFRIAIDDFGAGHSSLAYLQQLPANVVKIDQSFIGRLTAAQGREHMLVSTMIALSHKLGFQVVAEGIETAQAASLLSDLGCEEGQGYWFARPLEVSDFES